MTLAQQHRAGRLDDVSIRWNSLPTTWSCLYNKSCTAVGQALKRLQRLTPAQHYTSPDRLKRCKTYVCLRRSSDEVDLWDLRAAWMFTNRQWQLLHLLNLHTYNRHKEDLRRNDCHDIYTAVLHKVGKVELETMRRVSAVMGSVSTGRALVRWSGRQTPLPPSLKLTALGCPNRHNDCLFAELFTPLRNPIK